MKFIAKIIAILVILCGLFNILTAWFYLAWTAIEQGGADVLQQQLCNSTSPGQDYQQIQEQIAYLKSHAQFLAVTAIFFLILAPLTIMSGVMLWKKRSALFIFAICGFSIVGEILSWLHFRELGILNWIVLGIASISMLIVCLQHNQSKQAVKIAPQPEKPDTTQVADPVHQIYSPDVTTPQKIQTFHSAPTTSKSQKSVEHATILKQTQQFTIIPQKSLVSKKTTAPKQSHPPVTTTPKQSHPPVTTAPKQSHPPVTTAPKQSHIKQLASETTRVKVSECHTAQQPPIIIQSDTSA